MKKCDSARSIGTEMDRYSARLTRNGVVCFSFYEINLNIATTMSSGPSQEVLLLGESVDQMAHVHCYAICLMP